MKVGFFLPQIAQFDRGINLSCLVFQTFEFLAIFFNNNFMAFDFIILSDLNSNPNNLIQISFTRVF